MNCKNIDCKNQVIGTKQYCSLSCRSYYNNKYVRSYDKLRKFYETKRDVSEYEYNLNPKHCRYCDKLIEFQHKHKNYCNQSCSAKSSNLKRLPRTIDSKLKTSESIKKLHISCSVYYNTCVVCKLIFVSRRHHCRKTCSKKCFSTLISINAKNNINCGGETNYKKFKYNNITMDSSWEVEIATWLDSLSIKWIRSKTNYFKYLDECNKPHRYHPDFYLPELNIYLDTKNGYLQQKDRFKIESVIKIHNINLIVGNVEFIKNKILMAI